MRHFVGIVMVAGMVWMGCSSSTPPENQPDAEADQATGDMPIQDLQPQQELPTTLGLSAAGGYGESESYRIRFVLSAPIRAGSASSESYEVQSGTLIQNQNQ